MRRDIYEKVSVFKMDEVKPNYSEISRRFDCDPRTVKRYYEGAEKKRAKQVKPTKLDGFHEMIEAKTDLGVTAMGTYLFIQKHKGYKGKYTTVRQFVKKLKEEKTKKATVRIETNPGLSAQVDWKEDFKLHTNEGKPIIFQIFLMVLGYSREKFLEVTLSRDQKVLFQVLTNAFQDYNGVPKEIWFDNMKTVVDQAKTQFSRVVFNQSFYYYAKDIGFEPIACRPYRPQTKGKVESLARLTERLRAYDYEIESIDDISKIVKEFQNEINNEISQGTYSKPNDLFQIEKEYLRPLPSIEIMQSYQQELITRKVTVEAMVIYGKVKYSVSPKYINKIVQLEIIDDILHIYYNGLQIRKHPISVEKFNYNTNDLKEILKSDVFKQKSDADIEAYIEGNMRSYDEL